MTTAYRTISYRNSAGEIADFSMPYQQFLYNIEGMGFAYDNTVEESNYSDHVYVANTRLATADFTGELSLLSIFGDNRNIYENQRELTRILNYDQLMRQQGADAYGTLIYKNASGIEMFSRALIKSFSFGEIEEDGDELKVKVSFDRISKMWVSAKAKKVTINLEGSDEAHKHPYSHPWTHGQTYKAGSGTITSIGGNHFAKLIIRIHGEVSAFTLTIKDTTSRFQKRIKYDGNVNQGETLIIDNFDMFVRKDGVNSIANFDLFAADPPFFDLMPGVPYAISVDSQNLRGSVEIDIYETWVSA
ncbi:hypothetical protein AB6M11_001526 [Listeria monocytogenes]|uniref:phage distal tail protein domain-containing protein n=1 Tax=Listeria seeligeri TaxID=1640 RepID=UPI0017761B73|nr:hypothetical protein [Listeria seeligeri]EAE9329617.1 hypothetical protein [Listeria monocytogenes]EAF0822589.1 hypothetical protein [Listeria monocytogenes]EHG2494128.1 hypothetical protein [Listeria monocytogenes]EHG2510026.1 hypothetical protein [Listeria monocytogenes]EIE7838049.1 hypothetical protein [Listeria monocytogenes]